MEPPKTLQVIENGGGHDLEPKKEVIVTLRDGKGGVYLNRFKVIIFTSAFLLCILLVVLLLTFVRQDETVRVTSPLSCDCETDSSRTNNEKLFKNITASFNDEMKNGSREIYAENLTYTYVGNGTTKQEAEKDNKTYGILNEQKASNTNLDRGHPKYNIRLSRALIPEHYDIQLMVDLENKTFTGSVDMILIAKKSTKYVVFHINKLSLLGKDVKVRNIDTNKYLHIDKQYSYRRQQFWIIELADDIDVGHRYMVEISSFCGKIIRNLKGLYLSMYEEDGETK